jgi:hypothetical protein
MRKIIKASNADPIAKKTFRLEDIQPDWNLEVADPGRSDIATSVNFRDIYRPVGIDVGGSDNGDDDGSRPNHQRKQDDQRPIMKPKGYNQSRRTALKNKHRNQEESIGSALLGMGKWRKGANSEWKGKHDPSGEEVDIVQGVVGDEAILLDDEMYVDDDDGGAGIDFEKMDIGGDGATIEDEIGWVMSNTGSSWTEAVKALQANGNDLVNAILAIQNDNHNGDDDGDGSESGDGSDADDGDGDGHSVGDDDDIFQERFRPVHVSNKEWHSRAWHNGAKAKRESALNLASEQVFFVYYTLTKVYFCFTFVFKFRENWANIPSAKTSNVVNLLTHAAYTIQHYQVKLT